MQTEKLEVIEPKLLTSILPSFLNLLQSKRGELFYQGNTLMNNNMNGEFPVLKSGANAISWTGTVTKVVVRPNWRYL